MTATAHLPRSIILLLLTAVAAVLRLVGANRQLWFDEMVTLINSVRVPMVDLLTSYPSDNQHTLFSVLAQLSVMLPGRPALRGARGPAPAAAVARRR